MNLKLVVALPLLFTGPAFAQGQMQPPKGPKPTKADVQKVVTQIGGDKAKLDAYCALNKINAQMDEAAQKNDQKQMEALDKQAAPYVQKLGPDYVKLMDGLDQIPENAPEAKDFMALF